MTISRILVNTILNIERIVFRNYLNVYMDVKKDKLSPLNHFIEYGIGEGRYFNGRLSIHHYYNYISKFNEVSLLKKKICIYGIYTLTLGGRVFSLKKLSSAEAILTHQKVFPSSIFTVDRRVKVDNEIGQKRGVSIIIPVYNNPNGLKKCLDSLSSEVDVDDEIIIYDNGSNMKTRSVILDYESNCEVKILTDAENHHFIYACNKAVSWAKNEILIFINSDTVVGKNAIKKVKEGFQHLVGLGVIGGKLVGGLDRIGELGGTLNHDGTVNANFKNEPIDSILANSFRNVDFVSGAFLGIYKELFEKVGGFDALFSPAYYEDVDLCTKVRLLGKRVVCDGDVIIKHSEHGSSSKKEATELIKNNHVKFVEKYKFLLEMMKDENLGLDNLGLLKFKNILIIDSLLPRKDYGQGSARMYNIVEALKSAGHTITFISTTNVNASQDGDIPRNINLLTIPSIYFLNSLIQDNNMNFDVIIISRLNNLIFVKNLFAIMKKNKQNIKIIYDSESNNYVNNDVDLSVETTELEICRKYIDGITAISDHEKLRLSHSNKKIITLGLVGNIVKPGKFNVSKNCIFYGGALTEESPNYLGLKKFQKEILPIILELDGNLKFFVHGKFSIKLKSQLSTLNFIEKKHLSQSDLSDFRISFAPVYKAAGLPQKIIDSIYIRQPFILTETLANLLNLDSNLEPMVAYNEVDFANKTLNLINDIKLWKRMQSELTKISYEYDFKVFANKINNFI
jgi:GT2 family glycosyltransferase